MHHTSNTKHIELVFADRNGDVAQTHKVRSVEAAKRFIENVEAKRGCKYLCEYEDTYADIDNLEFQSVWYMYPNVWAAQIDRHC